MTTPEMLAVIATLAGFVMALSPTFQVRRMFRTRSSRDVSIVYLSVLDLGFIAWVSYGWSIGNWALILSNTASLTFMTLTILIALRFRRARRAIDPVPAVAEVGSARLDEAEAAPGRPASRE